MTAAITAHNIDAERAVLGILIEHPTRAADCGISVGDLSPAQGHDAILSAVLTLAETKGAADPVLLVQELAARDQLNHIGDNGEAAGPYLHTLIEAGRNAVSLPHYVQLVRAATVRRRLYEVGSRLTQTATGTADIDDMLNTAGELTIAMQMLADNPIAGNAPIAGLSPVRDFLNEPTPPHSWVIPGLLEHSDRVMVVAGEGMGKSVLSRQVGVMLAAGRHPFSAKRAIPSKRVLIVDLENPPALVRRNLRSIVNIADHDGLDLGDRLYRWNRPGGLDLRSAQGRALFHQALDQCRPDLVCIGPLYKMSLGKNGDTYETSAAETAAAIDAARDRFGCAFWIEHHMAKPDQGGQRNNPIGSSYWMRWPEFGLVLRRAKDAEANVFELGRFRGDRDDRAFPERLIRIPGTYPWTADYDDPHRLDEVIEDSA